MLQEVFENDDKIKLDIQNCAQFHGREFCQDLFISWGHNPREIRFFEEHIERELDLVRQCMVGKQGSVF